MKNLKKQLNKLTNFLGVTLLALSSILNFASANGKEDVTNPPPSYSMNEIQFREQFSYLNCGQILHTAARVASEFQVMVHEAQCSDGVFVARITNSAQKKPKETFYVPSSHLRDGMTSWNEATEAERLITSFISFITSGDTSKVKIDLLKRDHSPHFGRHDTYYSIKIHRRWW